MKTVLSETLRLQTFLESRPEKRMAGALASVESRSEARRTREVLRISVEVDSDLVMGK